MMYRWTRMKKTTTGGAPLNRLLRRRAHLRLTGWRRSAGESQDFLPAVADLVDLGRCQPRVVPLGLIEHPPLGLRERRQRRRGLGVLGRDRQDRAAAPARLERDRARELV